MAAHAGADMFRSTTALLAILAPFAAQAAAPALVPVTGYLTDDAGAPIDGDVDLQVRLYATATGGTALFE